MNNLIFQKIKWYGLNCVPFSPSLPDSYAKALTSNVIEVSNEDKTFQFSHSVISYSLQPHGLQHARSPCPSPTPRVYSNSCQVCDAIQTSHPLSSPSPPSIFPGIRVLSNESVLRSGGQSIGVSALASVLPMNIQDWFPLAWTGWISLQSKGLKSFLQHHSSKTSILRHSAFFIVQLSHPYMTIGKAIELMSRTFVGNVSAF